MPNDWIIDVLEDLRGFARGNALPELEAELARVIPVARAELETAPRRGSGAAGR